MEFLQLPNRVVIVYEGGTHVFRSIPIGTKAGLKHPRRLVGSEVAHES